jgi:hypothetical protein
MTAAAPDLPDLDAAEGCEAVNDWLGLNWICGRSPAVSVRRICVHEHVKEGRLCRDHLNLVAAGLCRTCHELGGSLSHDCPIAVAALDGAP